MSRAACKIIICSLFALFVDDPVKATVEAITAISATPDVDDTWRARGGELLDALLTDRASLKGEALRAAEETFVATVKRELFAQFLGVA